jgi:hypothetical protein
MLNSQLLQGVAGGLTQSQYLWVANFRHDPNAAPLSVWAGRMYRGSPAQVDFIDSVVDDNTFYCTAVLEGVDEKGQFRRSKKHFVRLSVLVADDADPTSLNGTVTYVLETSPGKHQLGVLLDENDADCTNLELVDAVMQAMADASLVKADKSGNNAVRYVRLPLGTNTKARDTGPWRVQTREFNDGVVYSLEDAVAVFGLDLDTIKARMVLEAQQAPKAPVGPGTDWASLYSLLSADDDADRAYHDGLLKLSSKMVASGMAGGAVVESLRGLMLAVRPGAGEQLARWESRFHEIPRMVAGAERFRAAPVEIALNERDEGLLLSLDTLREATKNIRWLVKSLVPADSMGMLFGASGTFKSFVALDLSLTVAHGMKWCQRKTGQGSVVYVAAEGGAGIYRRVWAWHQAHKLQHADNFHVCVTPLLLTQEEQVSALRESIAALPQRPSLIVVDTLSQTFSGDENSSTDIAAYLRLLNTHLRAAFGATVLVIHHTGHAAAERPRGSSAITANLDFLLGCFRPNPEALAAQVEIIKQKDGDKLTAQYFEMHREILAKDEDGEEVSSLVAGWHDAVKAVKESSIKLNQYETAFINAMPQGLIVHEDELKLVLYRLVDNADTRRKYWQRTMNGLQEKRLIKPAGVGTWKRV